MFGIDSLKGVVYGYKPILPSWKTHYLYGIIGRYGKILK
jgi:hypothetical protein